MKSKMRKLVSGITAICMAVSLAAWLPAVEVYADEKEDDPMIVVSLGDSYSSGEGIPPFYGDNKIIGARVKDYDWLAHRSINSWPSKLVIPGYEGPFGDLTLGDYRCDPYDESPASTGISVHSAANNCQWYFVASSGATTDQFDHEQSVDVRRFSVNGHYKYQEIIPPQKDIFQNIDGTVDYVTLTMGGNDVGFSDIMQTAAIHSDRLFAENLLNKLWEVLSNLENYREKFRNYYKAVIAAAPEADIIVAGYPHLLNWDASLKGPFSVDDVKKINFGVDQLNNLLQEIVDELDDENKIHFVDVSDEFKEHEAYSADPWINGIVLKAREQDHDDLKAISSYSFHPNENGAEIYAKCVNEVIRKIEDEKKAAKEDGEKSTEQENTAESGEQFWFEYIRENLVPEMGLASLDSASKTIGENWNYPSVWDKRTGILSAQVADFNNDGTEDCVVYYFDTKYTHGPGGNTVTNDPQTTLYAQLLSKNEKGQVIEYEKRQIFVSDSISFCDGLGGILTVEDTKYVYFEVNTNGYYSNTGHTMYTFFTFDGQSFRPAYAAGQINGGSDGQEYGTITYDKGGKYSGMDVTDGSQAWYWGDGNYSRQILGSGWDGDQEAVQKGLESITGIPVGTVNLNDPASPYSTYRSDGAFERGFYYSCYGTRGSNGARKMKITIEEESGLRKE